MTKVVVYYFTKGSAVHGETIRSSRPATREFIERHVNEGFVLLEDTAQEVVSSRLDGNGVLMESDLE